MSSDEKDFYYDFYLETKLTIDEIRQFEELEDLSDNELKEISDAIFDLAVTAQKIIIETND